MAYTDLCHLNNTFKPVENEPDQSERIMEENSMVRDLITKILDETGTTEGSSTLQPPEKTVNGLLQSNLHFHKNESGHTSYIPPSSFNSYQDSNLYNNFTQNEQNNFGFNLSNGYSNSNSFINYSDNDVSSLLSMDPITDTSTETVTPEQLNLLRLAAQEIGGAQFTSPNNEKFYNFFEPNQRSSLPENNVFSTNNFNRPNSLNLDLNFNSNFDTNAFNNAQRFPNKYENNFMKEQQDSTDILSYLNQLNLSVERSREDSQLQNNLDFKLSLDMNGHYQKDEFNKIQDERSNMYYNRNFQQIPQKNFQNGENNLFINEIMKQMDRSPLNQNFDFSQATPVSNTNSMNYKPNGFQSQHDYMQRRDINQIMPRENFQINGLNEQRNNFENPLNRDANMQQAAVLRQNQELARQMSLIMRNRPPPNQLNVDVSFLHENTPFNLGLGALLGPNTQAPPPVLPSPMLDIPLLAPFYAMRNMRGAATSSGILHARLDACYEQWRQLERERKRTEARLALAYPGRAVSSSNSIPVPRLPPCPTRVDRLTVDMLREHTKVLTLMGKMETLRASVCVAQNKKPNKSEDCKITVLKRGQENVASEKDTESGIDPSNFDPTTWREDVKNLAEIAPHSEVESAMLAWRNAVSAVQAARRRELAPHTPASNSRFMRPDPILQLAEAVKQLGICARRARCAMWCDLTLTVALAPPNTPPPGNAITTVNNPVNTVSKTNMSDKLQSSVQSNPPKVQENCGNISHNNSRAATSENRDEKASAESSNTKSDAKPEPNNKVTTANKQTDKQQDKHQQRRTQNYRHKINQGRNEFYQKNQRYDNRFMHNRHPYHYLATGPIN